MEVRIHRLRKEFRGARGRLVALEDVDLRIEDGEFLAIVGPNGCGKSTLLNCVAGVEEPSGGSIEYLPGGLAPDGSRRREPPVPGRYASMVWQDFRLLPWRDVEGNVDLPGEFQGREPGRIHLLTDRFLQLLRLSGSRHAHPHELSGGMRQKAAIARALANEPEVLLMDEPLASLDPHTRVAMRRELLAIWRRERKTILYVTHDIDEAIELADRIAVMTARPGRIAAILPVDLPRPRGVEARAQPQYLALYRRVWELLEPR